MLFRSIQGDEIKALLAGTDADSVQKDYDSKQYFRVNLLARDANDEPVKSFGDDNGAGSYRHPINDYENVTVTPGSPKFTVTKVEYDIRINQHQFATGENRYISGQGDWTESDTANAKVRQPDYGSWFGKTYKSIEDIVNQMSFEVNGRMYTETTTAGMNMYVDTSLEVGGTNSGNNRPGHVALTRSDTPERHANDRYASAWSYQDYHRTGDYWHHYDGVAYMRHLRSRTNVVARTDGNYTMEGINWGGKDQTQLNDYDNYVSGTSHALFGGDVNFATSFYRHTIYRGIYSGDQSYTSTWGSDTYYPNDWGWNYTSFADKVNIGDTLPWCQPDEDLGYYGFLSTGLQVKAGVLNHLRSYDRATITFTTKKWHATEDLNTDGFAIFEQEAEGRTFQLRQDGLYEKNGETWNKISNEGLAFLTAGGTAGSGGYIQFSRPDEEPHKEIIDYKAANGNRMVTIPLDTNEFIATYDMNLGPYNGNGDITGEHTGLSVDRDGNSGVIDIRLLGRPYIYKGQKHPAYKLASGKHDSCGDVVDARNHVSSRSYNFKDLSTPIGSYTAQSFSGVHPGHTDWKSSSNASIEHRNRDTAYFLGYLIPYGYHSWLSVNRNGDNYHSLNRPDVPDYQADNLTPNVVRYETRFRNINDVNEGVDDENRAAHISQVRLRTSWNPAFTQPVTGGADSLRVQKVYVPAQFVPVGTHSRDDNWFRAQDFQFTVYHVQLGTTATVRLSWNDMINLGILSGTVSGSGTSATFTSNTNASSVYPGCFVIDIEKYLRMTEVKQANADKSTDELFKLFADEFGANLAGYTLAAGQTEADAKKHVVDLVQAGIVGHYAATGKTNTLGGAFEADPSVNLTYAAPYVTSAQFLFVSPHSNREKPATMLDSGQWLGANRSRNNEDYQNNFAFAYDGVYADREVEDFRTAAETGNDPVKGNWNYWSTPTFDKQGNGFGGMRMTTGLTVSDVVTRDPNKKSIVRHEDNTRQYDLSHRLGVLTTDMQRGKKVQMNGTTTSIFAYDADSKSATSPVSYNPDATTGTNGSGIPNGDLYAGDYVEYRLYVGAGSQKVRTDLTNSGSDAGTPFELDPLPLQHVDARFEVGKGQRIVGWEVEKYYDSTKKKWVDNNSAAQGSGAVLPVTAKLTQADGSGAINVDPQVDLSRATAGEGDGRTFGTGDEQYDQNRNLVFSIGDAYTATKNNANATSQIDPGRGVWIRVITQMTDEWEEDEAYNDEANQTNRNDEPSYKGKSLRANFYAVAAPLHGYTQYRCYNNDGSGGGNNKATADFASDADEIGYIRGAHSTGNGVADNCVANDSTLLKYSFITKADERTVRFDGYNQLAAHDHSNVVFHTHVKEKPGDENDANRVAITPEFWDWETKKLNPTSASGQPANADGNRMRLRLTNIRNSTWHEATMTVTVSFMRGVNGTGTVQGSYNDSTQGFDAYGNPAGKRFFELTRKPTYTADETIEELGYPRADVTDNAEWNNTTPAKRLGLSSTASDAARSRALLPGSKNLTGDGVDTSAADRRPEVKIEYYVPDWNKTATPATLMLEERETITPFAVNAPTGDGAWVSYEELAARYTVGDVTEEGAQTPEGHTANGNVFRDVTGVRMTYFDLPATADGVTAFPLDDVSLLGVSRYQDTRLDNTAVGHTGGEQQNLWQPFSQADVSFTHTDKQETVIDFVDTAKSTGPTPVMEIGRAHV